jgi:hypothetical protein
MESKRQKFVLLGSIILALLWLTPAVSANSVQLFYVWPLDGFNDAPIIKVYSDDGERWTHVDKKLVTNASLNMKVKCEYDGDLNSAYRGIFTISGMQPVGYKHPTNRHLRTSDKVSRNFKYVGSRRIDPIKVCNDELQNKLSQAETKPNPYGANKAINKFTLLTDGFTVNVPSALIAKFTLICHRTGSGQTRQKVQEVALNTIVDCQGTDLAKDNTPKPRQKVPIVMGLTDLVSDVAYQATPENFVGICPRGIKFKGHITATRAGQVKYQYVAKDGSKSPVFSLNFDKAGTKATGNWSETVTKPEKSEVFTKKGFNTSSSVVSGWWQLTIVSPEMKKPLAATAKYTVTCQDKPTQSKIKN